MAKLQAVIFDVDGTLADTERDLHLPAFNAAFAKFNLPYRWQVAEYGELLHTAGGRQRIAKYLVQQRYPEDVPATAALLHELKTELFRQAVATTRLRPRRGVADLLRSLHDADVRLAVCTTGRRAWVMPLLDQLFGPDRFEVVVTGDDVTELKPNPDGYLLALAQLGCPSTHVVAVEDSANGLQAARSAQLRCWVVTNDYTRDQAFGGAAGVFETFGRDGLTFEIIQQQ